MSKQAETQGWEKSAKLRKAGCHSAPPVALRNELVGARVAGVEGAHQLLAGSPVHIGCKRGGGTGVGGWGMEVVVVVCGCGRGHQVAGG